MRRRKLSENEIATVADDLKLRMKRGDVATGTFDPACPPVGVWHQFIKLVYAGNAPAAFKLLDLLWPEDRRVRARFETELASRLKNSGHWPVLLKLNPRLHALGNPPPGERRP